VSNECTSSAFQITILISNLRGGMVVIFIKGYLCNISESDKILISSLDPSGFFMIDLLVFIVLAESSV